MKSSVQIILNRGDNFSSIVSDSGLNGMSVTISESFFEIDLVCTQVDESVEFSDKLDRVLRVGIKRSLKILNHQMLDQIVVGDKSAHIERLIVIKKVSCEFLSLPRYVGYQSCLLELLDIFHEKHMDM